MATLLFQEYRVLDPADPGYLSFPEFLQHKFGTNCLVLAGVRTEQLARFSEGGCACIHFDVFARDRQGLSRPNATSSFLRVKGANANNPLAVPKEEEFCVVCTCIGHHEQLFIDFYSDGRVKTIRGNIHCWFGQLCFCRLGLEPNSEAKIIRYWKQSVWEN